MFRAGAIPGIRFGRAHQHKWDTGVWHVPRPRQAQYCSIEMTPRQLSHQLLFNSCISPVSSSIVLSLESTRHRQDRRAQTSVTCQDDGSQHEVPFWSSVEARRLAANLKGVTGYKAQNACTFAGTFARTRRRTASSAEGRRGPYLWSLRRFASPRTAEGRATSF